MTRYINVGTTKRLKTLIKAAFESSGLAIVQLGDVPSSGGEKRKLKMSMGRLSQF